MIADWLQFAMRRQASVNQTARGRPCGALNCRCSDIRLHA